MGLRVNKRRLSGGGGGGGGGDAGSGKPHNARQVYFLDPLLVPRVEQYSYNNDCRHIDLVVEYLRNCYKEYQRKQLAPFRKQVVRAVELVRRKMQGDEEVEKRLESIENRYMDKVLRKGKNEFDSEGVESDSDSSEEKELEREGEENRSSFLNDNQPSSGKNSKLKAEKKSAIANLSGSKRKKVVGDEIVRDKKRKGEEIMKHQKDEEEHENLSMDSMSFEDSEEDGDDRNQIQNQNLLNSMLRLTYDNRKSIQCKDERQEDATSEEEHVTNVSSTLMNSPRKLIPITDLDEPSPQRALNVIEVKETGLKNIVSDSKKKCLKYVQDANSNSKSEVFSIQETKNNSCEQEKDFNGANQQNDEYKFQSSKLKASVLENQKILSSENTYQKLFSDRQHFPGASSPVPSLQEKTTTKKLQKTQHDEKPNPDSEPEIQAKSTSKFQATSDQSLPETPLHAKRKQTPVRRTPEGEKKLPIRKNPKPTSDYGGSEVSSYVSEPRKVWFEDFGGIEHTLTSIKEIILFPLFHPEIYVWLGIQPVRGILLYGPPGCGKTMLAHAIANEANVPFLKISAPEIVSGMAGESEAKVRSLFQEASRLSPCIVFIDEIDAIALKRENAQREMERRIVAQLLTCMDDLNQPTRASTEEEDNENDEAEMNESGDKVDGGNERRRRQSIDAKSNLKHVIVLGATNRPDSMDPALRRAGRFDREISLGIPDENARARILEVISKRLRLDGTFDFKHIARMTPGFVGADLAALSKEAATLAIKRIFEKLNSTPSDLKLITDGSNQKCSVVSSIPESTGPSQIDVEMVNTTNIQSADNSNKQSAVDTMGLNKGAPEIKGNELLSLSFINDTNEKRNYQKTDTATEDKDDGRELGDSTKEYPLETDSNIVWKVPLTNSQLKTLSITMQDFEFAIKKVQPSSKREGFATIPDITWEDVGSLDDIRDELRFSISRPIKFPEEYEAMGLNMSIGILLYGPPGCGKTLIAKAIANDAGGNFISIKGPELLNKYVGESERAVRQLFARARASAPCVLFFDEMDAMAPKRGGEGNAAAERVVNQLLTEMDGLDSRKNVFLIAATNRPDMIDPALLRPGRLDKLLYVPLPEREGRFQILKTLVRNIPLSPNINLQNIAFDPRCQGFSGADLASLVRESCIAALRERTKLMLNSHFNPDKTKPQVELKHFSEAFLRVLPSVSPKDILRYERMSSKLRIARGHLKDDQTEDGNGDEGIGIGEKNPLHC